MVNRKSIFEDMNNENESGQHAVDMWSRLICNPGHERIDRELVEMSMDERITVFSDVGGAQDINTEEPAFVIKCFRELEATLSDIKEKEALDMARSLSPKYAEKFRLMMLRAENFDAEKSARRLVRYFEYKLELFGPDKLVRDITLKDLNQDDMESLQSGGIQILPNPDQFQRRIMFSRQINWRYKSRENMLRAFWYMFATLAEDDSIQRQGIVGVGYSVGDVVGWSSDFEMIRQVVSIVNAVPIRVLALYCCYTSPVFTPIYDAAVHMMSSFLRVRFRVFHGTHQECNYSLRLMGINHLDLPLSKDGCLTLDNHLKWIRIRQEKETS